jgi:hypothetical protein
MTADEIRDAVIASARLLPPPTGAAWDPRYGHGRISTAAMVKRVMGALLPPAGTPSSLRKRRPKRTAAPRARKRARAQRDR